MDLKIRLQYVSVALLAVAGEGALFCNTNQADAQATKSAGIMSGALRDACAAFTIGSLGGFVLGDEKEGEGLALRCDEAIGDVYLTLHIHQNEELKKGLQFAQASMCAFVIGAPCAVGTFFASLLCRACMNATKLQSDNERLQAQVSGA